MFKPVAVLFTLHCVLLCHARITRDYDRPGGNNVESEDEPKRLDYGYSKKSKYNRIVITTYLTPVPEEVAASYSSYVIHPVDNKVCGYNQEVTKPNPEAEEDSSKMASSLKLYPIVVEEIEEANGPNENKDQYNEVPQKDDDSNNDEDKATYTSYREWFFQQHPKHEDVLDDETRELFRKWFAKEEPKANALGYWNSFRNQFDTFYEDEFKQFFDVDDETDDEDTDDEDNDEKGWYVTAPQEYEYEDKNDDTGETLKYHYIQGPRYDMERKYYYNNFDDGNGRWNKW